MYKDRYIFHDTGINLWKKTVLKHRSYPAFLKYGSITDKAILELCLWLPPLDNYTFQKNFPIKYENSPTLLQKQNNLPSMDNNSAQRPVHFLYMLGNLSMHTLINTVEWIPQTYVYRRGQSWPTWFWCQIAKKLLMYLNCLVHKCFANIF